MNGRATTLMLATLALLLPLAEGSAQVVGPVINYQGRAQDASGQPLTGEQAITLRIYDAQSAGTPLFTESHPSVTFNASGIFTLVIGGNTPGGIPQTIGFDRPRWIGVTINGFNQGNELPRLRFYGSPYAFEANHAFETDHADSADRSGTAAMATTATTATTALTADSARVSSYADSTGSAGQAANATRATLADRALSADDLLLPALFANDDPDKPTLQVVNQKGPALQVTGGIQTKGAPYGIVSDGVDSTTKHFSAAEVSGSSGTPNPGSVYRDNVPLAWGQVDGDGTIISDFGIFRVSHTENNPGVYQIVLDNPVALDAKSQPPYSVVITPRYSQQQELIFPFWDYAIDTSTDLPSPQVFEVHLRGFESGVDAPFSVVVFGRPDK